MWGVPLVCCIAWEVLEALESGVETAQNGPIHAKVSAKPVQLLLQNLDARVVEELRSLDVSNITPLEAINKLYHLQKIAQEEHLGKGA